jgi:uncharacterized protein YjbI with pentapeptide repeats
MDINSSGHNLSPKDFAGQALVHCRLTGADLSGTSLSEANPIGASLAGAILLAANLIGANLAGAYGTVSDTNGKVMPDETHFE